MYVCATQYCLTVCDDDFFFLSEEIIVVSMDSEPSFKKVETVVKLDCVSVTFENLKIIEIKNTK